MWGDRGKGDPGPFEATVSTSAFNPPARRPIEVTGRAWLPLASASNRDPLAPYPACGRRHLYLSVGTSEIEVSHDASPTGASGLASPGWSFRVSRKGCRFHRFLKLSGELPDALCGNPANDKFGESDAHAALARRSQASKPN